MSTGAATFALLLALQQPAPSGPLDRAWAAYQKGNLQQAESLYQAAINEAPLSVAAHYEYGLLLKDLQRWGDATRQFKLCNELDPKFAAAHSELGAVYLAQERLDEAEKAFDLARKLDGKDLLTRVRLGYIYGVKGDYKKAGKELEEVVKQDADYALAWCDLGRVRLELKDPAGAVESMLRAVECDYTDRATRAAAKEVIDAAGSDADKGYLAAVDLLAGGKKAEAAAALEPLATTPPRQALLALAKADAETLQKAIDADKKASKAAKLGADLRARLFEALAAAQLAAKEYEKAEKTAGDALKLDPERAEFHYLLASSLAPQPKKDKKALESLTKALELGDRDALAARARTDANFEAVKTGALFQMLTKPPRAGPNN